MCRLQSYIFKLFVVASIAGGTSKATPLQNYETKQLNIELQLPHNYGALEGDVQIRVKPSNLYENLQYRLRRDDDEAKQFIKSGPIQLDDDSKFKLPCGYFSRGGAYFIDVLNTDYVNEFNASDVSLVDEDEMNELSDSVVQSWRFDVRWPIVKLSVTPEHIQTYPEHIVTAIIEFPDVTCTPFDSSADYWLELLYCGHSSGGAVLCDGRNISSHAHVLSSEQVRGFPGRRTMTLRCELFGQAGDYALVLRPASSTTQNTEYATAFIKADWSEEFVLNVHGGSVFPCSGAGVRALFQYPACVLDGADRVRVFGRENGKLRYVAERRVKRGQHSASFDCRLFTERYPEYCFVYVSQAVTGAVADVRMDCVPTLPLSEGAAGGWGPWSAWSPCPSPSKCLAATRTRHRFCDSPPPSYGAPYCKGNAVDIESCTCKGSPWSEADSPSVVAEVGVGCRCGCTLHLASHTRRLLAGSTRACVGHSFWLLKAETGKAVKLEVERVVLPCTGQRVQARAGDSLGSPLIASWTGAEVDTLQHPEGVENTEISIEVIGGRHILLDMRSENVNNEQCAGGFIAHAIQIDQPSNMTGPRSVAVRQSPTSIAGLGTFEWWWGSRGAIIGLAIGAVFLALCLAIHSRARAHKYMRASDKDQLTDSDACSESLQRCESGSRGTLLSAVSGVCTGSAASAVSAAVGAVSSPRLRRLITRTTPHGRLRESVHNNEEEDDSGSISTLTPPGAQEASTSICVIERRESASAPPTPTPPSTTQPSPLRRAHTAPDNSTTSVDIHNEQLTSQASGLIDSIDATSSTSSMCEQNKIGNRAVCDKDSDKDHDSLGDTNRTSIYSSSVLSSCSSRASSSATLTNGHYSPMRPVRTARMRSKISSTDGKKNKERHNKALALSDLSLGTGAEMEMDYYDYEVDNAGSVPGSYLGMDPAFLIWIPPLEEGELIHEESDKEKEIEHEILSKEQEKETNINKESPEEEEHKHYYTKENKYNKLNIIQPLNFSITDLQNKSPNLKRHCDSRSSNSIPMKELSSFNSPAKVHMPLKNDTSLTTKISDLSDIKFADECSDSSCDIKYVDDEFNDSNVYT